MKIISKNQKTKDAALHFVGFIIDAAVVCCALYFLALASSQVLGGAL